MPTKLYAKQPISAIQISSRVANVYIGFRQQFNTDLVRSDSFSDSKPVNDESFAPEDLHAAAGTIKANYIIHDNFDASSYLN